MLSLIDCFCHKELFFFRFFSDRKRITKASHCKDDTYERAEGEGGRSRGQELRNPSPNYPILHDLARKRTYPLWFLAALSSWLEFSAPGSQFSVASRFVLTEN